MGATTQLEPYEALAVANRFLALAARDKKPIDHLKLQKLIYFAHGWYLAFTGSPLLTEHVEAWQYGPVIPTVYHQFKRFGSATITSPAYRAVEDPFGNMQLVPYEFRATEYADRVIEEVWRTYKNHSGLQLSTLSHDVGSAWHEVWTKSGGRIGSDIPDELVRREFEARWHATERTAS